MYLKRLEIKGFKSFAESTELSLQPGLNIIVGPNGCGKSNVVDAIRWVLGENNVRHLRGQKNEDVIFNGSDKKKALGLALVEMTIDNSDHALPVEFGELTVVRKIFRTGESEFYINKSRVRMKDVVHLFTGTGIGKQGYSIISQGELEEVLNGQSFDRRLILEEAAGIVKYRQQRDEVQRRILTTSNDLIRVEDILSELLIRREELALKAEKAEQYQTLYGEVSTLERVLLGSEIRANHHQLQIRREELRQKTEDRTRYYAQGQELRENLSREENLIEEIRQNTARWIEEKHSMESDLHAMESEVKLARERVLNYEDRVASAGSDREKNNVMIEQLKLDLNNKREDLQRETEAYHQRQISLAQLEEEIEGLDREIQAMQTQFANQKHLIFAKAQREVEVKNQIIDQENERKKCSEKKERLLIHVQSNLDRMESLKTQNTQMDKQKIEYEQKIMAEQNKMIDCEKKLADGHERKQEMERSLSLLNREKMSLENKLIGLQELEKNYTGYSEGVRAVMKAVDRGEKSLQGIKGMIGNLIDVPAGMELAIDVAVGRGLENMVINTAQEAQNAIAFLKRERLGRVTFLPLDVLRVQPLSPAVVRELSSRSGVLGLASHLIRYDEPLALAVEYLFGRILIVENMDSGLNVFRNTRSSLRMVTLEGELINASGAMTGGNLSRKNSSPIQRKGEQKAILQQLKVLNVAKGEKEALIALETKKLEEEMAGVSALRNSVAELMFQLDMINQELENTTHTIQNCQKDISAYRREISELEGLVAKHDENLLGLQDQYEAFRQDNASFSEQMESIKGKLEIRRRDFEVRKERYSSQQEGLAMKKKDLAKLDNHVQQIQQVKESYLSSLTEAQETMTRLQEEIEKQKTVFENRELEIQISREELKKIEGELAGIQEEEKRRLALAQNLRTKISPIERELSAIEESQHLLDMRIVRMDTEREGLISRWEEKFGAEEWDQEEPLLSALVAREKRRRIELLSEQIRNLGTVDLDSIQEYVQLRDRHDFLLTQANDLKEARDSLQQLLKDTERLMSKGFMDFLVQADESFRRTFIEIFDGGEAELVVENSEDPFSSGVDIVVKMPGKRMQSLNLLSGGERALTCIAFILSLLRLKPTPFCLLDEIDAALDETNLQRFSSFIKGMSGEMQFIVITHRQATIEAGERIYGVTMPQEGVSSVLSLNFEDAQSIAG